MPKDGDLDSTRFQDLGLTVTISISQIQFGLGREYIAWLYFQFAKRTTFSQDLSPVPNSAHRVQVTQGVVT